jgi:tetratricopeptide (TPR) repeat protein
MNRITAIFAAVLVVSLTAAGLVLQRIDRLRAAPAAEEALYLPSARVLKRISLGCDGLLADVYWTRAVQYFGGKHFQRARRYDSLAPLLEIATELDPHLVVAYQFGSIFLAQQPPEGAGQPEKAVSLVERGIRANPAEWRLYYNLAWIEYDRRNYAAASRAFERGAQVPGAPPAMGVMAATTAQHGGEMETARLLWTQIFNTTEDKTVRATAIKHLQALQVDEDIAHWETAVRAYRAVAGRYPETWSQLLLAGWRGHILDPTGRPYRLKPDGRIEVQDPDQLPFITRGLPPGRDAWGLTPEQRKAIQSVEPR